ncbi:MAG TPA: tetratricopeptide repeat protein [Gemmatimonadaceae bacterium]|nr:tetratricopeptide repeat protein [Gemmatimonadaceae bacterium]
MRTRLACVSLILLSAACHPRAVTRLDVSAPCLEAEAGKAGRSACTEAVESNPSEPRLRTRLAASHVALGHDAEALTELEHAIRLDPRNFEAHYGAGIVLARMNRTAEALEHFRDARTIDPSQHGVTWHIANALRTLGQREEAFAEFRALVVRDPENSSAWSWMAITAAELGRHAEAVSYWQRTLELNVRHFDLMQGTEKAMFEESLRIAGAQPAARLDAITKP